MSNPGSLRRRGSAEAENRSQRRTRNDAETRAHLEAYMQAFLGTEDECIQEFEAIGIECWPSEDRADKR